MVSRPKPGIDWSTIEKRIRAGETPVEVAKDFEVSRQAIEQKADKFGWRPSSEYWSEKLDDVRFSENAIAKRPDTVADVLRRIELGIPLSAIAGAVGVHKQTIDYWKRTDPNFEELVAEARAKWHERKIAQIDQAAERGDWKAATWMLERHPDTKGIYGGNESQGGLTVVINVNRADEPVTIEAEDD